MERLNLEQDFKSFKSYFYFFDLKCNLVLAFFCWFIQILYPNREETAAEMDLLDPRLSVWVFSWICKLPLLDDESPT